MAVGMSETGGGQQGAATDPPLQVGEVVVFGEGRTGYITRAYPMENKYALKAVGATMEIKGPENSFFYFKHEDLVRAVPLPRPDAGEPLPKRQRSSEASANGDGAGADGPRVLPPGRFEGKVKWYSKEKGFGKIQPTAVAAGGKEPVEDVFLHRNQMDGGPDGPHAMAIVEGAIVTYEVTTHYDGKPCACSIQVDGVSRALSAIDAKEASSQKAELIRRLLLTGLQVGTFQVRGVGKASMEDRFILRPGVSVEALGTFCKKPVCALFGVFDGHSGASCADFVANNLDRSLFDCVRHQRSREVSSEMAMRSALLAAFRMTEHNYFQYLNKLEGGAAHAWATAGSTACSAAFFGPDEECRLRLAVANAGDSRVVMGTRDGQAIRLSEDHTPDVAGERRRIEQEGAAVVNANGIWRIVLPSKKGLGMAGLSVSRGFGDLEYKQPAGVVSAVPDVTLRTLDLREDCFLVFASDGVWNPVSDLDAVRIVAAGLREGGDDPARLAAQQLVEEAHRRDGNDDKTAVVIWFGDVPSPPPALERAPTHPAMARAHAQPRQVAAAASQHHGAHHAAAVAGGDDMFASRLPMVPPHVQQQLAAQKAAEAAAAAAQLQLQQQAVMQAQANSQAQQQAQQGADAADLDDLFASYAREMDR